MPGEPDNEGYEDIYEPLEDLWIWMRKVGVRDVPEVDVMCNEAALLAEAMQKDISYVYMGCANPTTSCHIWYFRATDGELYVCSGTTIQKHVWTMPALSSKSPSILWIYNHYLFKTPYEAEGEVMCKGVEKQANKGRGLHFGRCDKCTFMLHIYFMLTYVF